MGSEEPTVVIDLLTERQIELANLKMRKLRKKYDVSIRGFQIISLLKEIVDHSYYFDSIFLLDLSDIRFSSICRFGTTYYESHGFEYISKINMGSIHLSNLSIVDAQKHASNSNCSYIFKNFLMGLTENTMIVKDFAYKFQSECDRYLDGCDFIFLCDFMSIELKIKLIAMRWMHQQKMFYLCKK